VHTLIRAVLIVCVLVAAALFLFLKSEGLSARKKPSNFEYAMANFALAQSIPSAAKYLKNPLARTDDNWRDAREHFHEHCAVCHGDDGKGKTPVAAGMSPEVPDLSADHVQKWTDGEIFYIVKNGVRFTGMPGWDLDDDHLWRLVLAVRSFGGKSGAADSKQRGTPHACR
jgi:mono/diheme cytochrome c family protein